jgi:hypothetical protein
VLFSRVVYHIRMKLRHNQHLRIGLLTAACVTLFFASPALASTGTAVQVEQYPDIVSGTEAVTSVPTSTASSTVRFTNTVREVTNLSLAVISNETALVRALFLNTFTTEVEYTTGMVLLLFAFLNLTASIPNLYLTLFTRPFSFFGRQKKIRWGVVYDSFTKRPLDLAIVRLIDMDTNRIVQSRITDAYGRYEFSSQSKSYSVDVQKTGYTFPSMYLYGKSEDVDYVGLYFGGPINPITISGAGMNIPLDPLVSEETPQQVLIHEARAFVQHLFAYTVPIISIVIFLFVPSVTASIFVVGQVILLYHFRSIRRLKILKRWGVISDAVTHKSIPYAVVRIFDAKDDRLLEMRIADQLGHYGFLVRKGTYYLTAEAPGYQRNRLNNVGNPSIVEGTIVRDIALKPL